MRRDALGADNFPDFYNVSGEFNNRFFYTPPYMCDPWEN
jgi:hypothetical protein